MSPVLLPDWLYITGSHKSLFWVLLLARVADRTRETHLLTWLPVSGIKRYNLGCARACRARYKEGQELHNLWEHHSPHVTSPEALTQSFCMFSEASTKHGWVNHWPSDYQFLVPLLLQIFSSGTKCSNSNHNVGSPDHQPPPFDAFKSHLINFKPSCGTKGLPVNNKTHISPLCLLEFVGIEDKRLNII